MNAVSRGPEFSLQEIPFSHHGSWFNFSPVIAERKFAQDIHLVSHQNGMHPVLRLVPAAQAAVTATPARLMWRDDGGGIIELVYETADTVRVRGSGLAMRIGAAEDTLTPFSGPYMFRDPVDGSYV